MAKVNEVYRIHTDESSWKDVTVLTVTDQDTVTYTVGEAVNLLDGTADGDTGGPLDLTTVTNERLYDEKGVTDTEEAPDPVE